MLSDPFPSFCRVRKLVEEERELRDVNTGKVDRVAAFLVGDADRMACSQSRVQNLVDIGISRRQMCGTTNFLCNLTKLAFGIGEEIEVLQR